MKKMLFVIASFFAVAASVFVSSKAYSYTVETRSGNTIKWSGANATFLINTTNGPSFALTSLQAAMQNWTDVSTSNFAFIYGGSTSDTASTNDGVNIVYFGSVSGSLLGVATWWSDSGGALTDCDIIMDQDQSWTSTYLEDLATHEFGHCVPLGHASGAVTMNPSGAEGIRDLAQDDIDGITFLYPSDSSSANFVANTSIPTMNEWGMIIFMTLACGLSAYKLRRLKIHPFT